MEIKDITPGKSYGCYFRVVELVDSQGNPAQDTANDSITAVRRDLFGVIKTRDCENQLVELVETKTGSRYVVAWQDCWDVDEVEWHESN